MSTASFLLVLVAALLHAGWNSVVKSGTDRLLTVWGVVVFAGLLGIPILAVVGLPHTSVVPYLAATTVVHIGYDLTLIGAYQRADFSVAYPIARGSAPLMVTVLSAVFLGDRVDALGIAGVIAVSASLLVVASGRPLHHSTWAIATGATIALYTLIDGAGVRANGSSASYIMAGFVLHAIGLSLIVWNRRGLPAMADALRAEPLRLFVGGCASGAAYLLVMIAARTTPLGLVSGLRETSALFAVIIGALVFHEHVTRRHAIAVVVGVLGVACIAFS